MLFRISLNIQLSRNYISHEFLYCLLPTEHVHDVRNSVSHCFKALRKRLSQCNVRVHRRRKSCSTCIVILTFCRYMLALAFIGKAASLLFFFLAWWCYVPPGGRRVNPEPRQEPIATLMMNDNSCGSVLPRAQQFAGNATVANS